MAETPEEYEAALKREREHYVRYSIKDRLEAVDAELQRLASEKATPDNEQATPNEPQPVEHKRSKR